MINFLFFYFSCYARKKDDSRLLSSPVKLYGRVMTRQSSRARNPVGCPRRARGVVPSRLDRHRLPHDTRRHVTTRRLLIHRHTDRKNGRSRVCCDGSARWPRGGSLRARSRRCGVQQKAPAILGQEATASGRTHRDTLRGRSTKGARKMERAIEGIETTHRYHR